MKGSTHLRLPGVFLAAVAAFAILAPKPSAAIDQQKGDEAVKTVIEKRLVEDRILTANNVQVTVADSTITLDGSVGTLADKTEASRIAHNVEEHYQVVNNLAIQKITVTNEQLAQDVANAIRNHIFYSVFNWVTIGADNGDVILRGWVYQPWYVAQYVDQAGQVPGVTAVTDSITVLPVSIYDDQIRHRAARAIYNNPMFRVWANTLNPPIHIIVINGDVILEGWVRSQVEKTVAADLVAFNTDAFSVDNRLEIRFP